MANDLSEIHDRLDYCKSETGKLRDEIDGFYRDAIEIRVIDAVAFISLQARQTTPLPISIPLRGGTIIHEARACLDALACVLAIRNGKSTSGTYFPISKSQDVFNDDGIKKIKKLSLIDQEKIVNLKPFKGADDFLFGIHDLDRIRKHVRLFSSSIGRDGIQFDPSGYFYLMKFVGISDLSDVWQPYAVLGPGSRWTSMSVNGLIRLNEPPELRGADLMTIVPRFIKQVREIVGLFD
jgi:hypothetical protein